MFLCRQEIINTKTSEILQFIGKKKSVMEDGLRLRALTSLMNRKYIYIMSCENIEQLLGKKEESRNTSLPRGCNANMRSDAQSKQKRHSGKVISNQGKTKVRCSDLIASIRAKLA